ncbi:MAG: DUF3618 domain-containing protein [Solirubrobacteraceae bacterium]
MSTDDHHTTTRLPDARDDVDGVAAGTERIDPDGAAGAGTPGEERERDPETLRREIHRTSEDLGDTVEALSAKADVKGRAKEKIDEGRSAASERAHALRDRVEHAAPDGATDAADRAGRAVRERPQIVAVAVALVFGLLVGIRIGGRS